MPQAQREWFEKDYYKALGVGEKATEAEIRRAYRKLAKKHHPDANPGSEDRFKEISTAYDVLSDPKKRREYDEVRRLGPMAAPGAGGGSGTGAGGFRPGGDAVNYTFTTDDLGDLFGGLFGRFRSTGHTDGATTGRSGPRRGEDLEAELHLSFLDAINGVTTTVNVESNAACSTCHGSGAAPGTSPVVCSQCSGRGVLDDNQGLFSLSRTCPTCAGRGMVVEKACPTCRGTGLERRARQVKVRVQPGVGDGQRLRLKGKGGAGANGGPPGDLYVTVRVGRHPLFTRRGRDLSITVPITYPEAALGADIAVPTLDGSVVVKVPPGTRSGRTFRVRGRGVPTPKGTGDLLVTVEVVVPSQLSPAEREAIEALATVSSESPRAHLRGPDRAEHQV